MAEPTYPEWLTALTAAASKYGAGIAGAVLSLRFQSKDATRGDRAWAVAGGLASVLWGVPAAVELLEVTKPGVIGLMGFLAGVLGMAALSELSATVRSAGLVALVVDGLRGWIRRIFGLSDKDKSGGNG
jgi:hypothetical protein